MTMMQLLILALVQGITEFLPVSSSGHLALISPLTGWPDQGLTLDVSVHLGTLTAVIVYFWSDVRGVAFAGLSAIGIAPARRAVAHTDYPQLFRALVIATLPVVLAGFALKASGLDALLRDPAVIATTTLIFGIALWVADILGAKLRDISDIGGKAALLIGTAQILALIPGTSRSGITMTAARLMGFNRTAAARFSMLMSIPVILAASGLIALDIVDSGEDILIKDALIGAALAALAAFVAIHLLMRWLARASMAVFALYRIGLAGVLITLILTDSL